MWRNHSGQGIHSFNITSIKQQEGVGASPKYKVKMQIAFCFNNHVNLIEYYHNSAILKMASPEKAVRNAFVSERTSTSKVKENIKRMNQK